MSQQLDLDLTTEEGVAELLKSSMTEDEWDENCDKILAANNQEYPDFWYKVAIPIASELTAKWQQAKE
jgi:hypothetical protein